MFPMLTSFLTTIAAFGMTAGLINYLRLRHTNSRELQTLYNDVLDQTLAQLDAQRRELTNQIQAQDADIDQLSVQLDQVREQEDGVLAQWRQMTGGDVQQLEHGGRVILPARRPSRWARVRAWLTARPRVRVTVYRSIGALLLVSFVGAYWQAVLGFVLTAVPVWLAVRWIQRSIDRRRARQANDRALAQRADDAALWWLWTGEHVAVVPDDADERVQAWVAAEQQWIQHQDIVAAIDPAQPDSAILYRRTDGTVVRRT